MGYENIAALNPKPLNFRFIVNGVILIVLVFTTFQELNLTIQRKTPDYLMGINSEESYLENNLGWYAVAMEHIRTLKPAKPVLLLFEPRDYYCLPYCDSDEILDEWYLRSYLANAQSKNSEKIIQDLMTQGYGYILIYQDGVDFVKQNDLRYTSRQWDLLTQLTSNLKPMANFGNSYLLYQVTQ